MKISPLSSILALFCGLLHFCDAETVDANFITSSTIPVTAASYTATGNDVQFSLGFAPPVGTNLTVVKNTGLPFISGEFSNLAHGQVVNLSYGGKSYRFVANYYGDSGNDLVLEWGYRDLAAWGSNSAGRLGNGSTTSSSVPLLVDQSGVLSGKTVVAVSGGWFHSLALCSDGTIAAWGSNSSGQLGNNSAIDSSVPVLVTQSGMLSGKTVVAVSAGYYHSLALCSDGTIAAWGENGSGQLGNNSTTDSSVPVPVNQSGVLSGKAVVAISAGSSHSLALCSDGAIAAWGSNGSGRLGNGSTSSSSVPVLVVQTGVLSGKTVVAVSAGGIYNLALCSDGAIAAWGHNSNGQLGNSSTTNSSVPVLVNRSGVLSGKTVVAIAAGLHNSLALCSDGTIAAWGSNSSGELGNNSTTNSSVPVLVNRSGVLSGKTVVAVSAGSNHSLALCSDGTLAAWGLNSSGELGNNSTTNSSVPVLVNRSGVLSGKTMVAVSAGVYHNLSLSNYDESTAGLFNLSLSVGTISPQFDPNTTVYSAEVSNAVSSITFRPESLVGELSVLKVNESIVASGSNSQSIPLDVGANVITILVTAPDGITSKTYKVTVTRMSNVSTLSALTLSSGSLSPNFASNTMSYTASVANATSSISVKPTLTTTTATVRVNGALVISGSDGESIPLTVGSNTITVVGISQDGTATSTYTLTVTRISNVSTLSSLTLSSGTLSPGFASSTTSYTASVANTTTAITVRPTLTTTTATVRVNGTLVASDSDSQSIPLTVGSNTITVVGTAEDGTTTSTYTITVTRQSPLVASFTSPSSIPVTAASYTATGNDVQLSLGFAPPTGTNLTVVKNTGLPFISGEFSNLAHGQVVNLSYGGKSYRFVANYYGGSGNDLVLEWGYRDLAAWGNNEYGQLGDSSSMAASVPVLVTQRGVLSSKTVVAVSAGKGHSLALCSDGTIAAWGSNSSGQLGNSSTTNSSVPVLVNQSGVLSAKTVVAISAGDDYSLALCSDGTIAAWGGNLEGQLGNGSTTDSSVPVRVTQNGVLLGKTVVAVSAGGDYGGSHSLALCADGTIAAWGANRYGQLGNNSTINSSIPVVVTQSGVLSGKTVVAVSAGFLHSLALCSDGTLASWGWNGTGQLGNNSTTDSSYPVRVNQSGVLSGKAVTAISAGRGYSLALCLDGTIAAWGYNRDGRLGNNSTSDSGVPVLVTQSGVLSDKAVVAVSAGSGRSIAMCSDGTIAAWGSNYFGGLGNNSTTDSSVPVQVSQSGALSGKTVVGVSAGSSHSFALSSYDERTGYLSNFSLSSGNINPQFDPTKTVYSADVSNAVSSITVLPTALFEDLSVLKVNGIVVASGNNSQSIPLVVGANVITILVTAPDGITTKTYTVTVTRAPSAVSTLSALTLSNGNLGPVFASGTPNYTASVANATTSITVRPTLTTTTATVRVNGTLVTAGSDSQNIPLTVGSNTITVVGTAEDGTTTSTYTITVTRLSLVASFTSPSSIPVTAASYTAAGNIVELSLGFAPPTGTNLTVIKNTGLPFISGHFSNLPHGHVVNLTYGEKFYQFVANYYGGSGNDLVLEWAYRDLTAWGLNSYGQLGNNSTTNSSVPVQVTQSGVLLGKTVVAVSAGSAHCLALCSDGTVAAWGWNGAGQLGNNSTTDSRVPVLVSRTGVLSGKTVVAVSAGSIHSLALCSDGTVAAWGRNQEGQLGNNSITNSSVPVLVNRSGVLSGKTVVAVSAGDVHSLALCSDGTVAAWGSNDYGQLGNNSTTNSSVPVLVNRSGVLFGKTVLAVSGGGKGIASPCARTEP